ncbi:MAG: hypothetical protein ACK4K7_01215 [Allosphingosinicella sp.]|uniref:hypothetical protein n=1 Tax=Allosphingosinicella sp. TaxID=2823234 RepID=UPI003949B738
MRDRRGNGPRRMAAAAGAAFAVALLAGCGGDGGQANGAAETGQGTGQETGTAQTGAAQPGAGADPATANLTFESAPGQVDQAVNQTDRQSGVPNAVDEATNSVR